MLPLLMHHFWRAAQRDMPVTKALFTLLLPLVLLFVFGQTWLLDQVSYSNTSLYVVVFAVPAVYFLSFWSLWGATPGKLLLLPWLER